MKAMIFAAGLGSRLQPLTNDCPKALVKVNQKPLLQHCIEKLKSAGVKEIIVNIHHFADMIEAFLQTNDYFGIRIEISDERKMLLDTGGGLKKAVWFFDDHQPFLLHNVDIFSNIDLLALYDYHMKSGALVTLACNGRNSSRYFLFDHMLRLCGWENIKTGEQKFAYPSSLKTLRRLAFGGIHVVDPAIFPMMPSGEKFSIIDSYLRIMQQHVIMAYTSSSLQFLDLGKLKNLELFEKYDPSLF